jgi:hypothetical protein
LHETTGHYWPKQFQVYFDSREMKPLNVIQTLEEKDRPDDDASAQKTLPEDPGKVQ